MNVKENTKRFSATQDTRPVEATRQCYTAGLEHRAGRALWGPSTGPQRARAGPNPPR